MPAEKIPDIERTKKRVLTDYKNGIKPRELSEKYNVNINTVKSWIRRADKGEPEKAGAKKREKRVQSGAPKKRRGAPEKNTNAVGNSGGAAPVQNSNALIHGGYSPVYWDTLTDEEKALLDNEKPDSETLLREEIDLLSIRERRILERIRKISEFDEKMPNGMGQVVAGVIRNEEKRDFDSPEDKELYEATQRAKIESGNLLPGRKYNVTTRTEATYDVIHRLEEALTRCQAQKQKCIRNLMELRRGMNDSGEVDERVRLEVEAVIRNVQASESERNEAGSGNPVSAESSG